jgi:cation diffusion facilitator CzcD-associated flavoprotein CzcO
VHNKILIGLPSLGMNTSDNPILDALIVGSGFSGLCVAVKMQQAGMPYVVLEQAGGIGGTWRDNTYPGAACDVPSNLYCFSFAPNPKWSRTYPQQAEIQTYMNECADRFDVRKNIQFNKTVTSARFDSTRKLWRVEVNEGAEIFEARTLVMGVGGLSRPQMPNIQGIESFTGELFHTARWKHDVNLEGKRVGIIGTGASAIQIVPEIADKVRQLDVFQRTPPWLIFKPDFAIAKWHRVLRAKLPILQKINRAYTYGWHESWAIAFTRFPSILKVVQLLAKGFLSFNIRDKALREKLMPSYVIGCKRVLLSNTYLSALKKPNVSLITDAIECITPAGIRTRDGNEHPLDIIIASTGFLAAEAGSPFPVYGLDNKELNEHWKQGPSAYLGTTVSGFPNFFIMTGPNTALGHNSMIYMIESQASYVMSALKEIGQAPETAFDIPQQTQNRYNDALQKRLAKTVWNTGGCSSWYLASNGLNTTLWPDFTFVYRHKTRRFDVEHYQRLV